MAGMVTAVVVDDHPFYRDGVARGLVQSGQVKVLAEAAGGREGVEAVRLHQPDVAVVDHQMPDLDGVEVVRLLTASRSSTAVLLLSAVTSPAVVYAALEEGARGYLSKESRRSRIVDAVLKVARGQTVLPEELAAGLAEQIRLRSAADQPVLSERERQVLEGFARGQSIPELAAELYLGASTVKTHTQRLYQKLGVSDRAAVVAEAMRRGLLA
jgi:two-component system nitrate/nitrite response regulator NarL